MIFPTNRALRLIVMNMKSKALRARIDLYSLKTPPAANSSTPATRDCSGVPLLPERGMSKGI